MLEEFEAHLRRSNLSENTISSYLLTIRMYQQLSGEITEQNLLAFKGYLIETYKPKTVNLRIQAINKYLEFIKKDKLRLAPVKILHSFRHRFAKNFLEKYNDISLLADLMGHESIETTRIYLRKTASEQQEIVDKIVTW